MAIAAIIISMLVIVSAITYFFVMLALAILGLVLLVGLYLVGFVYSQAGAVAAALIGFGYAAVVSLAFLSYVKPQE